MIRALFMAFTLGLLTCAIYTDCLAQSTAQSPRSFVEDVNRQARAARESGNYLPYSRFLVDLLMPDSIPLSYHDQLAQRLATAESKSKIDKSKLVSDDDVARAFNDIVSRLSASSSIHVNPAALTSFRDEVAHSIPEAFSRPRDKELFEPTQGVLLLFFLIFNDGANSPGITVAPLQPGEERRVGGFSRPGPSIETRIHFFVARHSTEANIQLFEATAGALHF